MLATFVIGLREGLEAALIVGIIAAFLRKNDKSLVAMWAGVLLAVLLSIAVGVGLDLVEQALPQAAQEGMESVIGAIAIFFVTGMIVWMNTHARNMKRELEAQAAEALSQTSAYALAGMAFLAVLREGFETAVFLLATFSAAQSAALAATGAVIGVLVAIAVGWAIYVGGVKINLGRFFRITGAFLILVAAGLAITALRTAHEAGWLNAGQQATIDLAWLVAPGTVQSALITGVLGIPADPRLIELLGWLAYLVPVALYVYWPVRRRPSPQGAVRLQFGIGAVLALAALALAVATPPPHPDVPTEAALVTGADAHTVGTARLRRGAAATPEALDVTIGGAAGERVLASAAARREDHDGVDAQGWTLTGTDTPDDAPTALTLDQVVALAGGSIPRGLNPQQHPGPFDAKWAIHRSTEVWTAGGLLLDAAERTTTTIALSGSGLMSPRTLVVADGPAAAPGSWTVAAAYRDQISAALNGAAADRDEWRLWAVQVPILLVLAALAIAAGAARGRWGLRRATRLSDQSSLSAGSRIDAARQGATHVTD